MQPNTGTLTAVIALFAAALFAACNSPFDRAVATSQPLVILTQDQLPNNKIRIAEADRYVEPLDQDSIELIEYRGKTGYQPVYLCHRSFLFLSAYRHTGDIKYLNRATKHTRKLMSICTEVGDAMYAPYPFRFAVHGDSALTLEPPWYSGMAQGELLGMTVRLYEITGDAEYLQFADRVFNSFLRLKGEHEIWTVRLDSSGYYWIEEYPLDATPGQTLNGFILALYGVYDYLRVTGKPEARKVYDMSLSTLKQYLPQFRRKDQLSLYCLGHSSPANNGYHYLHIEQMNDLARISGDPLFTMMEEVLTEDTTPPDSTGS